MQKSQVTKLKLDRIFKRAEEGHDQLKVWIISKMEKKKTFHVKCLDDNVFYHDGSFAHLTVFFCVHDVPPIRKHPQPNIWQFEIKQLSQVKWKWPGSYWDSLMDQLFLKVNFSSPLCRANKLCETDSIFLGKKVKSIRQTRWSMKYFLKRLKTSFCSVIVKAVGSWEIYLLWVVSLLEISFGNYETLLMIMRKSYRAKHEKTSRELFTIKCSSEHKLKAITPIS